MNSTLTTFARQQLKEGLATLPADWQQKFKMMYSHKDLTKSISDVVDDMPEEKLDWAMKQVENSINKINSKPLEFGYCEGDVCKRSGCVGVIKIHPVENCSCHISPPCGSCTEPREYCQECGWEQKDNFELNDYVCSVNKSTGVFYSYELRALDSSKIDWHSKSHSSCSMIKEGVYPQGTSFEEVEKEVRGTFGGRFEYFGNGKFKYIAYTD